MTIGYVLFVNITYSAENIGILEDDFFKDPGTIVTIREVIPHGEGYMAIVDGTSQTKTKTASLSPFYKKLWKHEDDNKTSKCEILATVICGTKKLESTLKLKDDHSYTYLRDIEDKTSELALGETVTFYKIKLYERPDNTIFREQGSPLYMLIKQEERVPSMDVYICFKEWVITSQWQRKTRHARRIYSAVDIYHTTLKRLCNVTGANDEIIHKELARTELRFKSTDPESPECGNNGGNLPNKAVIIS